MHILDNQISGKMAGKLHYSKRHHGFTLMELMITVVIVGIIASVAIPAYLGHVTKTNRRLAEGCLTQHSVYMERYHTTNLRYDQDPAGTANPLPALGCDTNKNLDEAYGFTTTNLTQTTYTANATPTGRQASRDAGCGTLSLNEAGTRGVSGASAVDFCW